MFHILNAKSLSPPPSQPNTPLIIDASLLINSFHANHQRFSDVFRSYRDDNWLEMG